MIVPVRRLPQTRVSEQQQGYARAVPGLDVSPITNAIEGFRNQLQDEQRDRQKFELNKRTMDEINKLQADFEIRRHDPEESPVDFADRIKAVYEDRHKTLLEELREEGYDNDLIEEQDLKLGTIRQGFFEKGLGHQVETLGVRAKQGARDLIQSTSQYVVADYNNYGSARDMFQESVRLTPDLTEIQRVELEEEGLGVLRDAGGKAMAMQNPQLIIDKLDPQGLTAPRKSTAPASSVSISSIPTNSWQGVATTVAGELGLDPVEVAAVMSYETAGTFSPTIMGGKNSNYMGLIQFGREERKKYGITETSTPEEWTRAILGFMRDRGFRKGMSLLDFYSTINAGTPGRYNASDGPGKTVTGHVNTLLREHKDKAANWLASIAPAEVAPSPSVETGVSLAPTVAPVAEAKTGIALLDDMNGPERLQVLGWAREQLNKVNASRKAEMDVTIGNITAEALNNGGEIATPLPTEADVLSVYGPVEGPQRWAQIQQSKDTGKAITTFRTQSAADIQRGLDAIEPKPGSPTYQTELQIYEAAERAAQHLLKERQDDPAAYAMKYFPSVAAAAKQGLPKYYAELDRVYETLGIDSSRAPLLSAEAARQMTQDYKLMSPQDKLAFMRDNYKGMGEDRFRRFVSNMEGTTAKEDANIYALLRTYPASRAGEIATIYQQVLEGREIMAQDPARRPSAEAVNKMFQAEGLSAIANLNADASRAIQETAAALYVAKGGDPKTIDAGLYREALATALGGSLPVNMRRGNARDYTILPPKVTRKAFEGWLDRQTFQSITAMSVEKRPPRYGDLKTPVPITDIIDEGVFVMVSPGRYMIKMSSDGKPLMTSTGRPFLVNLRANDVYSGAVRQMTAPIVNGGSGW